MQTLDSKSVVLKNEDAAEYQQLLDDYCRLYQPNGILELDLVHELASLRWRLRRCASLESIALEAAHAVEPDKFLEALTGQDAHLRFLARYEGRLRRAYDLTTKQLCRIKSHRAQLVVIPEPARPLESDITEKVPNEPMNFIDAYASTFRNQIEPSTPPHAIPKKLLKGARNAR